MIILHSHSIAQIIQTPTNRPGKILLRDLWWGYVDESAQLAVLVHTQMGLSVTNGSDPTFCIFLFCLGQTPNMIKAGDRESSLYSRQSVYCVSATFPVHCTFNTYAGLFTLKPPTTGVALNLFAEYIHFLPVILTCFAQF